MKISKTLVLNIFIGLAIALIIAGILVYLNVPPKENAEMKISAETRPGEALITSVFIDNDIVLEVFPAIAKQAGISIIADESVAGLVTCELKGVPLDSALDIILAGTPYIVIKTPDCYFVRQCEIKTTNIFIRITKRFWQCYINSIGKNLPILP